MIRYRLTDDLGRTAIVSLDTRDLGETALFAVEADSKYLAQEIREQVECSRGHILFVGDRCTIGELDSAMLNDLGLKRFKPELIEGEELVAQVRWSRNE